MSLEYKLIVKYRHPNEKKIRKFLNKVKRYAKIIYSPKTQKVLHYAAKLRGVAFPNFKPPKVEIDTKMENGTGVIELLSDDKDVLIGEVVHLEHVKEKIGEDEELEWETYKLVEENRWIPFQC